MGLEGVRAEDALEARSIGAIENILRHALKGLCHLQQLQGPGTLVTLVTGDELEQVEEHPLLEDHVVRDPGAPLWGLVGSMFRMCLVLAS